jgi:hypothetical protein
MLVPSYYKIKIVVTDNPLIGWLFNKTYKAVSHQFGKNTELVDGVGLIVTTKMKYIHFVFSNVKRTILSKEYFEIQAAKAQEESQNKADPAKNPKA